MIATQAGIAFSGTRHTNAAAVMILSTSGSMSLPKSVISAYRRAISPSI